MRRLIRTLTSRLGGADLARESVWGLGLELAMTITTIVSFTMLGRSLGTIGYGEYASLYAIVSPLVTLAASGVVLALLEHVIRDREPLDVVARSCLSITLGVGVLLTIIGTLIAFAIVDELTTVAIITLLATEFLTVPIVQVVASTVQASDGFIGSVRIRLLLVANRFILLSVLFFAGALSVTSLGIGSLVTTLLLAVVLLRTIGRAKHFAFRPGRVRGRDLRTNGVYSVGISAAALSNDGDKLVLSANGFKVDTGLYAAAYRILGLGMIPVGSAIAVSHQRFLHPAEGEVGGQVRRSLKFAAVTAAYGAVFAVVIVIVAPLIPLIIGDEFEGSVTILRWLSPLVLLKALAIFPLNGLMGLGKNSLRSIIIVGDAVLAMTLYVLLIPSLSWKGAAIGTLVTDTILVIASWSMLLVCQRNADRATLRGDAVAESTP